MNTKLYKEATVIATRPKAGSENNRASSRKGLTRDQKRMIIARRIKTALGLK